MVTPPTFSYSFSSKTTAEIHTSRQARPRPPTPHSARSGSSQELTLSLPGVAVWGRQGRESPQPGRGGIGGVRRGWTGERPVTLSLRALARDLNNSRKLEGRREAVWRLKAPPWRRLPGTRAALPGTQGPSLGSSFPTATSVGAVGVGVPHPPAWPAPAGQISSPFLPTQRFPRGPGASAP